MKYLYLMLLSLLVYPAYSQDSYNIEPSVLECMYDCEQEGMKDSYIMRAGNTTSQFFSVSQYRTDSLLNTSEATLEIATNEFFESIDKEKPTNEPEICSTIYRERLYLYNTLGKLKLYSNYADARNCYEDTLISQKWNISADSAKVILGYTCHYATTMFHGRLWKVWYTENIPMSLGPWKLNGLPGLILKATADDGFITFTATRISTENIPYVRFINFGKYKYYNMTRERFLKYKNRPRTIPYANKVLPAKPYIEKE